MPIAISFQELLNLSLLVSLFGWINGVDIRPGSSCFDGFSMTCQTITTQGWKPLVLALLDLLKKEKPPATEIAKGLGGEVNNYRNQLTIVLSG